MAASSVAFAQNPSPQPNDYRARLAAYTAASQAFEAVATPYWTSIGDKRKIRNAKRRAKQPVLLEDYVLTQPPVYTGPQRPSDPSQPPGTPPVRKSIPVVADFLVNAREHFQFAPRRPSSETEYKIAYARFARTSGITRDQAVRVYGFESGGNGRYDVQAGLESDRPGARAISTALGYNQLLTTNSISLLVEHGTLIVQTLRDIAASNPARRAEIERKIATVQQMIAFCKSVPHEWYEQERLGVTPRGLGVHALILDADIGPILQTLKLTDSIRFARMKGYTAPLSAAELEMMNLTGDGNGFDMVSMPQAMRDKVPTSNFFQRGGYERNPVASRNNTVSRLLAATDAKMDKESQMQGAKDLAAAFN